MNNDFQCRENCGACCIAPSISSKIPDMPNGKRAGVACIHLDNNYRCLLFAMPSRPLVCQNLRPCYEMCGNSRQEAFEHLENLEELTRP
ncbi:YkgJ family cysteine cluster protein [Orbus sturtevantii]|uniref:YkgJ family cysteine cluster protein n=1 Tax=Orbus sturtevantii TaxID=3074109 RepID=UPI00370D659F